ncbi:MAG: hypothetical protein V2I33_24655 [Kangiellaceae bacterium]|jgi:hypothetical protein|nr:hypothetical protein [Kangiellaceae bacterium]
MEDFLTRHMPKAEESASAENFDTYSSHMETTINRRKYLGSRTPGHILWAPQRDTYTFRDIARDLAPTVISAWCFGLSLTITYPLCVKTFRRVFPGVNSFILTHLGIAPFMMVINSHILGFAKGLTFLYFEGKGGTGILSDDNP